MNGAGLMSTKVEYLDYNQLCDRLLEAERETGLSTIEFLDKYFNLTCDEMSEEHEQRAGDIFLYLGTTELRRFHLG